MTEKVVNGFKEFLDEMNSFGTRKIWLTFWSYAEDRG